MRLSLRRSRTRDWTLAKYQELCEAVLGSCYQTQRIDHYIEAPVARAALLRHDIDRIPGNAIAMAKLECDLGIQSTYYVRATRSVYSPELVSQLDYLGHEVGYHYEVMSKTRGDVDAAIALFEAEIETLRAVVPVRTAASHGAPLSPWNNLDIWRHRKPGEFGLLGEAYLQIDYAQMAYYTDTGRSWSASRTNLRDRVDAPANSPVASTTDELIGVIDKALPLAVCLQTHPERWNLTLAGLMRSLMVDYAANTAKVMIASVRSSS